MHWEQYKNKLKQGETVQFCPKGNSMEPILHSGQLITVKPIKDYTEICKRDIVFCKVKGRYCIHLVSAIKQKMGGTRYQISNNKGHTNGWIGESAIFGKIER